MSMLKRSHARAIESIWRDVLVYNVKVCNRSNSGTDTVWERAQSSYDDRNVVRSYHGDKERKEC